MTIFLFSGQGTQTRGMGRTLFKKFPMLIKKANEILGYSIEDLCLNDFNKQLNNTKYTQPAIFTVNALAYLENYYKTAEKPYYVAGHSLGEYNALFSAKAFDFETGILLVKKRGELMGSANDGAMAAIIGINKNVIEKIIADENLNTLEISNENSPKQFVISGEKKEIELAQNYFEKAGASMYSILNVSGAFHSKQMKPIVNEFEKFIQSLEFKNPEFEVIANVSAKPYEFKNIKKNLIHQLTQKVKWTETIKYLLKHEREEKKFFEFNPSSKKTLTKLLHQNINFSNATK